VTKAAKSTLDEPSEGFYIQQSLSNAFDSDPVSFKNNGFRILLFLPHNMPKMLRSGWPAEQKSFTIQTG
jgi:hypothetical protein